VLVQVGTVGKRLVADVTNVRLLASVYSQVLSKSPVLCESALTELARVWLFSLVPAYVTLPSVFVQERFGTEFTLPWPLTSVSFHV